MNQDYFEKMSDMAKKVQEPFQAMAELNIQTLQNLAFVKSDDFATPKKPEELLEKQIELALSNGHKALDYMQKSFQIIEKSMLSMLQTTKCKTDPKK